MQKSERLPSGDRITLNHVRSSSYDQVCPRVRGDSTTHPIVAH